MPTQKQMMYDQGRKIASLNDAMMEVLYGPNPISDDELRRMIDMRPAVYGRFSGYLGKRA